MNTLYIVLAVIMVIFLIGFIYVEPMIMNMALQDFQQIKKLKRTLKEN